MEAQKFFKAPTHDDAGLGDYGKMIELLSMLIDAGHQRAFELIRLHFEAVERVANALLTAGKLEYAAAPDVLGHVSQTRRG
jgi:hypothetical protein